MININMDKNTSVEIFTEKVEKVMRLRDASIAGRKRARDRSKEVMKYIEHEPFSEIEREEAKKNNKPLLRYNILVSKLQTIVGNEQAQKRDTDIIPDYWENEELCRLISDNYAYIKDKEGLDRKLTRHLTDGLLYDVGGWLSCIVDIDDMGYNTYRYENLPPLLVHPDKDFRNIDLSDCRYIIVDEYLTLDEIRHKWGVSKLAGEDEKRWWEQIETVFTSKKDGADNEYKIGDRYLVSQMQERVEMPIEIVRVGEEIIKVTDEELEDLRHDNQDIESLRRASETRIKYTTVVPYFETVVLQERHNPLPVDMFSIFYVTSFDWNMRKCDQPSWGYLLLDVQDRINKGKSQEVDYMIQKLGGTWHIQKNEKEAIEDLKNSAGEPNAIIKYNSLRHNKAIRETGAADSASVTAVQNGVYADMQFMEEVSSVTQALQGKGGKSAESGVLYQLKRDQSLTASNPFYDIRNSVSERVARHFLKTIPYVYFEDDRLMPLIHNDSLKYEMVNLRYGEEILRDIRSVTARAKLEDIENTPNKLQQAFEENLAFAQMLINAGFPREQIPFMLIVKHSTIRDKQDWMDALERGQELMAEQAAHDEAMQDFERIAGAAAQPPTGQSVSRA